MYVCMYACVRAFCVWVWHCDCLISGACRQSFLSNPLSLCQFVLCHFIPNSLYPCLLLFSCSLSIHFTTCLRHLLFYHSLVTSILYQFGCQPTESCAQIFSPITWSVSSFHYVLTVRHWNSSRGWQPSLLCLQCSLTCIYNNEDHYHWYVLRQRICKLVYVIWMHLLYTPEIDVESTLHLL